MPLPPRLPRRVLVLATTFPATPGDGTPEFVLTLAGAMARHGVELTVLAPRVPGGARDEVVDGVRVHRFAYFPRRWERLADGAIMANLRAHPWQLIQVVPLLVAFQFAALRAAVRGRPEIVHAHWIVPAGVVARLVRTMTRTPYVVTAHGADAYTMRGPGARSIKRFALRKARATVPVSREIAQLLGPLGEVRDPVPMAVDVPRIRRDVGARHPEPMRILFVGRLVTKKGVDVLLRAAATLPHARVVVAGSGPLETELQSLAQSLGMTTRTEFLGHLSRAGVMDQLARASVIALPSQVGAGGDQDGVPVVLAEAIAAGVPVVASAIGGLAEHLRDGENARLVEPGSVADLAAALGDVLDAPVAAETLARRATETVLPALSVERTAQAYLDVFAEVLPA